MPDRTDNPESDGSRGTATLTRSPTTADPAVANRTGQPGRRASAPWRIPRGEWLLILKRAWASGKEHHVSLLAAGVAFFGLLAIFPAIIATVTVYGLVSDPADVERQVEDLASGLPDDARALLTSALTSIASTSSGSLTLGLVISVLAALWAASGGVNNLVQAIGIAYREQDDRNVVRKRGLALLLTLGAIVFVVVAVALIAVLPGVLDAAGLGGFADSLIGLLRWLGLVVAMLVALAVLYRLAPDRADARWEWVSVGAVAATLLWVIGSILFSVYVDNFGSYQKTYGALAGVIVLMLWLYLSAYAVLFGAEVNAEAELETARDTTTGPEAPMGQRGAYVADRVVR